MTILATSGLPFDMAFISVIALGLIFSFAGNHDDRR